MLKMITDPSFKTLTDILNQTIPITHIIVFKNEFHIALHYSHREIPDISSEGRLLGERSLSPATATTSSTTTTVSANTINTSQFIDSSEYNNLQYEHQSVVSTKRLYTNADFPRIFFSLSLEKNNKCGVVQLCFPI